MTLQCNEEVNKIDKSVTRFVLPLGMTLHMNGSAMFYSMAALFMGQMQGMEIGLQQIAALCLSGVLLSMAFPALPLHGGSVVNFMAACAIINVPNPFEILSYIMTMEWLM